MIRTPKGVSAAPAVVGRSAVTLNHCSQQKQFKVLSSAGVKAEFFGTGLSSPPVHTVPLGYFTQICNTAVAEQRTNSSLYSTPHGPEAKAIRSSSGRLPVNTHTHTHFTLYMFCRYTLYFIITAVERSLCSSEHWVLFSRQWVASFSMYVNVSTCFQPKSGCSNTVCLAVVSCLVR